MKFVRLFCVCCVLLVNIGCTKQEKNVQEPLNSTIDIASENDNGVVNTTSKNNISIVPFANINIILKAEDTKGVTDIAEYFREYLKDKSDEYDLIEYNLRVGNIIFHQEYSPDGNLDHLEGLDILFPNLSSLTVRSNLSSVDIHTLPSKLVNLNLSNNKIVSFDTDGLPQTLTWLNLSNNNLSSFCIESPPHLMGLDLSFNNLFSFDTSNLPSSIISLKLSDNPIEGIFEITQNIRDSGLGSLYLSNTLINRITGLENLSVGTLDCANSPIEDIEEFLKLKFFMQLIIPIPQRYSDEEKEGFIKKLLEQYPDYTYWLSTVLFNRKEHLFFSHPSPE